MFTFHSTKRRRDDDSDSEDDRYAKKSRSWNIEQPQHGFFNYPTSSNLPFRVPLTPSPPQFEVPPLTAPTPAQSDHSENEGGSPDTLADDQIAFSSPHNDIDMEMDDNDDFDITGSQPPDSPFVPFMRPAKLNAQLFADPSSNTGRIPTPIHGSFYAPRGPVPRGGDLLGVPEVPILTPPVMRKQVQVDQDRGRRMPSPISEDEDIPDTPTALTQSQLSRLSVTNHQLSDNMEMDGGVPDVSRDIIINQDMQPPPTPLARKGRARSGAFTGKGRFSMGYREDCDKCKARIPGHYSHFLPA